MRTHSSGRPLRPRITLRSPPVDDSYELLKVWQSGDRDAGDVLFERHYGALSRFFFSKAGDGAPDLIQRTFLVTLENRLQIYDGTSFQSYLFGVARNVLFDHYRANKKAGCLDPETQSVADQGPTPTGLLADAGEARLLLLALRQLPMDQQIVLELYYWEDMTAAEVGHVIGKPEPSIRNWLRSAKQTLAACINAMKADPALVRSTLSDLDGWVIEVGKLAQALNKK